MLFRSVFLRDHIEALNKEYDIYLVANIQNKDQISRLNITNWHHINISRNISIKNDILSIYELIKYFHYMNFDAVHSVTPKAGLITAISAWLTGIKHRTHIFTGQVWATRSGIMRQMLKMFDIVISLLDNHIIVDGEPQRQFLIENHIVSRKKSKVLGAGSISGVNVLRFTPSIETRNEIRKELNISDDKIVFCFMGRQNTDKGIFELFAAFDRLLDKNPNCILLLYGSDEENCMDHLMDYKNIRNGINLIYYGITKQPNKYLQGADVFCMPSYREGFGTSVIEASCLGLPVICTDIYGLQDTMIENETGLRCKAKDIDTLFIAMEQYADNRNLINLHGEKGRSRVLKYFSGEEITKQWLNWYNQLLK